MSLIWHIALKDLRRLRVLLGLWVALIAAKLGVGLMLIYGVGYFDPLFFGSNGLAALEIVTGYLLVASLVHGDVLVGSTSFWMTRPISSGRLFTGKLMGFAVIFGAIPLMLTLPWWLICGYGVKEILLGSAETLLLQGMVLSLALPLATLTDGLGRFLFWTLIWVTAAILGFATIPAVPRGATGLLLSIFVISGMVGAVLHGLRRRFFIGGTLVGATAIVAGTVLAFWFSARHPQIAPPFPSTQPAAELDLSFIGMGVRERVTNAELSIAVRATGVPPELLVRGSAVHRWTWSDRTVLERASELDAGAGRVILTGRSAEERRGRQPFRSALGSPAESEALSAVLGSTVNVPIEFVGRVRRETPAYLLRAEFQLMRPVVIGERPARTGEKIVSGRETTRVIADLRSDGRWQQVQMKMPEYIPAVYGSGVGRAFGPFVWSVWPKRVYLLIDRTRRELSPDYFRSYDTHRTKVIRVGTVGIVWRTLYASQGSIHFRSRQPDWFEDISVAKFELREVERFTKELRVERFELSPSFRSRGGER